MFCIAPCSGKSTLIRNYRVDCYTPCTKKMSSDVVEAYFYYGFTFRPEASDATCWWEQPDSLKTGTVMMSVKVSYDVSAEWLRVKIVIVLATLVIKETNVPLERLYRSAHILARIGCAVVRLKRRFLLFHFHEWKAVTNPRRHSSSDRSGISSQWRQVLY